MNINIHSIFDFIIEFFVVTIIFKYIILGWVADRIRQLIKFIFLRTEREVISWIHYHDRAMDRGHSAKTPSQCQEGDCRKIK